MGKGREWQIILKTDQRTVLLELGQGGKCASKSSGWDEKFPRRERPKGAGLASAAASLNVPCKVCAHACPATAGQGRPRARGGGITLRRMGQQRLLAGLWAPPASGAARPTYVGRWLRP
jgi:hypothetical protein